MPMAATMHRVLDPIHAGGALGPEALEQNSASCFPATPVPLSGFLPEPATPDELQLVQRIFFLSGDEAPRIVVFCGVQRGDEASMVCARAAEVLSSMVSDTVCLIDADLRSPSLHLRYEIDNALRVRGQPRGGPAQEAARMRGPNLWVLPAAALKDARPGFSPDQVRTQLAHLRERFGFLLIAAPPLGTAAEGFLLGQVADGVVLTVSAHYTERALAQKVRRNLELYNVRLLGAVMTERLRKQT